MDEHDVNVISFPPGRSVADPRTAHPSSRGTSPTRRAERRVTVLVAELRGWRTITEAIGAARAEVALAGTVDRALEVLLDFDAFDVTLDGEPMQPVISAILEGHEHALRALRAAEALRAAVAAAQLPAPPGRQFQLCVGVNSGDIADVTVDDEVSFEWIGTLTSFATRLGEFAGPGQVLISAATRAEVRDHALVGSIGDVRLNPYGERQEAFILTGIDPAAGDGRVS